MNLDSVVENYFELKNSIDSNVELLIVTKGIPEDFILNFIEKTGHKFFGENYVKELKKWENIKNKFNDIKLSFIGSFQSGNIKNIVKICDRIESISSLKIFNKIQNEVVKRNLKVESYAQINIGREPQKNGFFEEEIASDFNKHFTGIMCIPPINNSHIYFDKMKEIAKTIGISKISMGMSADYKQAIKSGATEIRIGSLIFKQKKFEKST